MKKKNTGPLVIGGDMMVFLLENIRMETLSDIIGDLIDAKDCNRDLIKTCRIVQDRRQQQALLESRDTLVSDPQPWV